MKKWGFPWGATTSWPLLQTSACAPVSSSSSYALAPSSAVSWRTSLSSTQQTELASIWKLPPWSHAPLQLLPLFFASLIATVLELPMLTILSTHTLTQTFSSPSPPKQLSRSSKFYLPKPTDISQSPCQCLCSKCEPAITSSWNAASPRFLAASSWLFSHQPLAPSWPLCGLSSSPWPSPY